MVGESECLYALTLFMLENILQNQKRAYVFIICLNVCGWFNWQAAPSHISARNLLTVRFPLSDSTLKKFIRRL